MSDRSRRIADRIAAQPGPRRAQGLVAPLLARVFAWPYRAALAGLVRVGVSADQMTVLSLALNVVIAVMLVRHWRFLPGVLLLPAGLLDVFDGAVARARGRSGPWGAWFDSVVDRAADAAVLGALFLSLAMKGSDRAAAVALGALVVSLVVSYARAMAEGLGVEMREGLFARLERYVALMVGLTVPGALEPALAALVAFGAVTLAQRVVLARAALRAS